MKKALFLLIIALSLGITELQAQNWNCVEEYTFDTGPLNSSVWFPYYPYNYYDCSLGYWTYPCHDHNYYPNPQAELTTFWSGYEDFSPINGLNCLNIFSTLQPHLYSCYNYLYKSGMIYSINTYQYGKFEIKCKLPQGQGYWPAFWLWCGSGEIDILEINNDMSEEMQQVQFNVHNANAGLHDGTSFTNSESFSFSFHTFSVEWSANHIKWFVDNELRWMVHSSAYGFPSGQMHVIANLAVQAGTYSPDAYTIFPDSMNIDYIKIYEQICPSYVLCDSDNLASYSGYNIDIAIPYDVDYNGINEITWQAYPHRDYTCEKTVTSVLSVNAENCITLNSGFSVELGAEFNANIVQCSK